MSRALARVRGDGVGGAPNAPGREERAAARVTRPPPPAWIQGPKPGLRLGLAVFPTPRRGATSGPEDWGAGTRAAVWERERGSARAAGR